MPVEAVFTVTGRGVVLAGRIRTGVLRVGQKVEVWDGDEPVTDAVVGGIEMFASNDESVGLLLESVMDQSPFRAGQTVVRRRGHLTLTGEDRRSGDA
jgi:elongation factor Tu